MRILIAVILFFVTAGPMVAFDVTGNAGTRISVEPVAKFTRPWAMTFVAPELMLITTKPGKLWLVSTDGKRAAVRGVPDVAAGGQGGLGDVVTHPDFARNGMVYLSYAASNNRGRTRGAVVMRARLDLSAPALVDPEVIWTQTPFVSGEGHYSHKLAFGPKGGPHEGKLFITSGDRQKRASAPLWDNALGKIIRLNDDGTIPRDNPFQEQGDVARSFWSVGHRNLLGISFDSKGRLWTHEMGPAHGDELNLIERGKHYGWPHVSEGNHYSGKTIPNHDTRPEFTPPKAFWVPSIAPSGLVIHSGRGASAWRGDALIGGLASRALIHVDLNGSSAREAERFSWNERIREVEEAPDGSLWILEDRGRLLRVSAP